MPVEQDRIDQIKRQTDLSALVRHYGITLSKKGKDLVGLCPFHEEKTPSFTVTPVKNLWHCFGCGAGGDAIEFVRKIEKVDFPQAIEKLSSFSGQAANVAPGKTPEKQEVQTGEEISRENHELLDSIVSHYQCSLKNSPEALRYLESRGLFSEEAFNKFRIGYVEGNLSRVLPNDQTKATRIRKEYLRSVGILREKHHEHFEGCLTFPIFDNTGALSEMYGRSINYRARQRHLYLPGPHKGIFNPAALSSPELILCESVIDALTFYVNGLRNVTCSFGVEGFTDELFEAIRSSNVKTVLFAYDRDVAGDTAAGKHSLRLKAEGIETKRIRFPMGMDANEYAVKYAPARDPLLDLVRNAGPVEEESVTPAIHFEDIPTKSQASQKPEFEIEGDEIRFTFSERSYRVRGLFKNSSDHTIKINLKVSRGDVYFLDTFDILSAKSRQSFIDQAAREVAVTEEILKYDLGRILAKLEELQEKRLKDTLDKKEKSEVEIPAERRAKAEAYLKDKNLVKNLVLDFEKTCLVGERVNSLMGYLGALSRKTEMPLAIIMQSASSAGKTTLMDAILRFVPPEDRVKYSMMTGQSLYYMYAKDLKYTIIAISEDEGMEKAKYAIKLLQSERKIVIVTTIKDPVTGLPETKEFVVEGPVMFLITSTNAEIDEELQNRCFILTVNESEAQTRLIQMLQRRQRTREGLLEERQISGITELHEDVQRLIRAYKVEMPFVMDLDFPSMDLRTRRDHMKFLTLIESIALLHQYQREKYIQGDIEHLIATEEDVALAAFLLGEVFGISVHDLAPQTKRLLDLADDYVTKRSEELQVERRQIRFTRRELREHIYWSDTRLRKHLDRLADLEYVLVHGGGQGKLAEYELLYEGGGNEDINFIPGLLNPTGVEIDPELLEFLRETVPDFLKDAFQKGNFAPLKANFAPQNANLAPTSHPVRTGFAPPSHPSKNDKNPYKKADFDENSQSSPKTHI